MKVYFTFQLEGFSDTEGANNSIVIEDNSLRSISSWLLWGPASRIFSDLKVLEGATTKKVRISKEGHFVLCTYGVFFKHFERIKNLGRIKNLYWIPNEEQKEFVKSLEKIKHELLTTRKKDLIQYAASVQEIDPIEAFYVYRELAGTENLFSMYKLAVIYQLGINHPNTKQIIPINKSESYKLFQRIFEKDKSALSYVSLATCYYNGDGTKQDHEKAFNFFKTSLKAPKHFSHQIAFLHLAKMLILGQGTIINLQQAREYLNLLENHTGESLYLLGLTWLEQDAITAHDFFKQSRIFGYIPPENHKPLSNFSHEIKSENQLRKDDYLKAQEAKKAKPPKWEKKYFKSLLQAAINGNRDAQYEVSFCFSLGTGTQINLDMANEWLKKAAENGHRRAKFYYNMNHAKQITSSIYDGIRSCCGRRIVKQNNVPTQYDPKNDIPIVSIQEESHSIRSEEKDDKSVNEKIATDDDTSNKHQDATNTHKENPESVDDTIIVKSEFEIQPIQTQKLKKTAKKTKRIKPKKDEILEILNHLENYIDSKQDKIPTLSDIRNLVKKNQPLSNLAKKKINELIEKKPGPFFNTLFDFLDRENFNLFKSILPGFLHHFKKLSANDDYSLLIDWLKKSLHQGFKFELLHTALAGYVIFLKTHQHQKELTESEWENFLVAQRSSMYVNKYGINLDSPEVRDQFKTILLSLHALLYIPAPSPPLTSTESKETDDLTYETKDYKHDNITYALPDEFAFFSILKKQAEEESQLHRSKHSAPSKLACPNTHDSPFAIPFETEDLEITSESDTHDPISDSPLFDSLSSNHSDSSHATDSEDFSELKLADSPNTSKDHDMDSNTLLPPIFAQYLMIDPLTQAPVVVPLTDKTIQTLSTIKQSGASLTFGVAGVIRDRFLKRPYYRTYKKRTEQDIDLVTEVPPGQVCELFDDPTSLNKPKEVSNGIVILPETQSFNNTNLLPIVDTTQIKHSYFFHKNHEEQFVFSDPLRADFLSRDLTINGFYCDELGRVYATKEALEALTKKEICVVDKREFLKLEAKAYGREFDEKAYAGKTSEQIAYEMDIRIFLRGLLSASYGDLHFSESFTNSIPFGLDILKQNLQNVLKLKQINTLLHDKLFRHQFASASVRLKLLTDNGVTQILFPGLLDAVNNPDLMIRLNQILFIESDIDRIYAGFLVLQNKKFFDALNQNDMNYEQNLFHLIMTGLKNQPLMKTQLDFFLAKQSIAALTGIVKQFIHYFNIPLTPTHTTGLQPLKKARNSSLVSLSHFKHPRAAPVTVEKNLHPVGPGFIRTA